MTHRTGTIAAHIALAGVLLLGAALFLWEAVSYTPDPVDPWPVGPGLVLTPLAVILLAGVGAVGLGLREWASSGNRRPMLLGDVLGMMALVVGAIAFPDVLTVTGMIAGVVAGGFAVAKPSRSATDGDRTRL